MSAHYSELFVFSILWELALESSELVGGEPGQLEHVAHHTGGGRLVDWAPGNLLSLYTTQLSNAIDWLGLP